MLDQQRDNIVTATVIADASFCDKTMAAGWASYIKVDGQPAMKYFGNFKSQVLSNNEAEALATMNGIFFAAQAGATHILAQTDSIALTRKKKPTYLKDALANLRSQYNVVIEFRHVKGHSKIQDARSHCQRWCDKVAKKIMREQRTILNASHSKKNN